MAKSKNIYVCQNCGHTSSKWLGRCPECGSWNSYVEETHEPSGSQEHNTRLSASKAPEPIDKISTGTEIRIDTSSNELNRILGGGFVKGSVALLGGEPGIGKSTLALQLALSLSTLNVLYVSGEESQSQIKVRADRINYDNPKCLIYAENQLEHIINQGKKQNPDIIIIDSIQTIRSGRLESSPGNISQIRECTQDLINFAKSSNTAILIIGHINKEGQLAGPKVLEHMVDTVLQFEGRTHQLYRILRTMKNRFGSTSEITLYEMTKEGLKEIVNPSELLVSHHREELSGIAISSGIEGIRPLLIEVQALVSSAAYGTPQRSSTGFDAKRLNMLLAVLEKRAGFRLATKDVFLNIAGGIKVEDPAMDLAVICAVLSSDLDIPLKSKTCFAGEVGLSGEIRPVSRIDQRISEAEKLGFETIFISKYNKKDIDTENNSIEIKQVSKVEEVMEQTMQKKSA